MPVPTAVPPSGSSASRGREACSRSMPYADLRGVAAELLAEGDRGGVHQVGAAGLDHRRATRRPSPPATCSRWSSAGIRLRTRPRWRRRGSRSGTRRCDDCEALTWSFGCTCCPSDSVASVAITSLVFMFELVPEPVWKTSIGKSPSYSPAATGGGGRDDRVGRCPDGITPSRALTLAAAPLIRRQRADLRRARAARRRSGSSRRPAGSAPGTCACGGTRTSPMVSCSIRKSSSAMAVIVAYGARCFPPGDRVTSDVTAAEPGRCRSHT